MREINEIVIHCSATLPSQDVDVEDIRDWHVNKNGWSDIGYHYVIKKSGEVQEGRKLDQKAASVLGHNENIISICLVGGLNMYGESDANYTIEQYMSLVFLVERLKQYYEINLVSGHRDYSKTYSPCFDVKEFLRNRL